MYVCLDALDKINAALYSHLVDRKRKTCRQFTISATRSYMYIKMKTFANENCYKYDNEQPYLYGLFGTTIEEIKQQQQ